MKAITNLLLLLRDNMIRIQQPLLIRLVRNLEQCHPVDAGTTLVVCHVVNGLVLTDVRLSLL